MCSGSEAVSYLRLIDFVYHSTLGLRAIKKKRRYHDRREIVEEEDPREPPRHACFGVSYERDIPALSQGLGFRVQGLGFGV